jgi:phosphate transport system permease protein
VASTTSTLAHGAEPVAERRIELRVARSGSDRIYRAAAFGAGGLTFVILTAIGTFLLIEAWPALKEGGWGFFTETEWNPDGQQFGIGAVMVLTVEIAVVALAFAVPVAIGAALFITDYAPRAWRRPLTSLIDLLAAVPSIIYGLWGLFFLQPRLIKVSDWLGVHMSWIPIFKVESGNLAGSTFIAGVVVSLMVLPICASIIREVFSQAPPGEKEGALALGGTRWGMIRTVVIPFGRGGIIGGSMLGLGRALGETIAVALIISPIFTPSTHILDGGGNSISALIALRWGESTPFAASALMAAGLALFTVTLAVNAVASIVVARSRSGAATEI